MKKVMWVQRCFWSTAKVTKLQDIREKIIKASQYKTSKFKGKLQNALQ